MTNPQLPPYVASGQPIASAWGNGVIDRIGWDTTFFTDGGATYYGALLVQGASGIVTSNVNGVGALNWPLAYAYTPSAWVSPYMAGYGIHINTIYVGANHMEFQVWDGGTPWANQTVAIQWGVIGVRAT